MAKAPILIIFAALLAACMPGRIDRVHVSSSYAPAQYHHLPYTPYLRAETSGNPFGVEQAVFDALVDDAIQPRSGIEPSDQGYRVHMAFNGPEATNENFACTAKGGLATSTGEIRLIAAFCSGSDQAITYLLASVSGVNGPDDPKFREFIRWSIISLFPPASNDDRAESTCFWPDC